MSAKEGKTKLISHWDECHEAMREVKSLARIPEQRSIELRDACYRMRGALQRMMRYPPVSENSSDLRMVMMWLDRVIELANTQECGALGLAIGRAMESAWRRMSP